jgi:S-DNA-T family DNA segregation ATPase FtsK/SpoIIIE
MLRSKKKSNKSKVRNDFRNETSSSKEKSESGVEIVSVLLLRNEKARRIVGVFLLIVSVSLLLSFISFFSSWKADQDLIVSGEWSLFKKNNPESVRNIMGPVGAYFSHLMVHKWFGIAALLLLPFPFLVGIQFITNSNFKLFRWFKLSFFTIILSSLILAFVFQSSFQMLGGGFGYHGIEWMRGLFGSIGTAFALALSAFIFSVIVFDYPKFNRAKPKDEAVTDTSDEESESDTEEELSEEETTTEEETVEEASTLFIKEDQKEEEEEPVTVELSKESEEEKPEPEKEELSFEVKDTSGNSSEQEQEQEQEDSVEMEVTVAKGENGNNPTTGSLDTAFDPTQELSQYQLPTLELLNDYKSEKRELDTGLLEKNKNLIVETLSNYKIEIAEIKATIGPTVTLYEIIPAPGVKISKIRNLEDDIALSLAALGIRIIAPIPGRGTIGIEVPNKNPEMVSIKSVLSSKKFRDGDYELPIALGKTISNEVFVTDLTKMPHLLMAGATGQGKSVGLNAILVSILYKKHPAFVKFVLVDPKKVELTLFKKIERHYLAKLPGDGDAIITDNNLVINTLNSLCIEMDERYKLLQDAHCRNLVEYNKKFVARKLNPKDGHKFLPYIVVVIDEVADLIMTAGKEIETPIARIAQLARAIGIHLILATQRPSVDIITGKIKANFPARIAFRVMSKIDSRTILDTSGADQLIGKGDMLYVNGSDVLRLQCAFVDTPEVEKITDFIGSQRAYPTTFELPEYVDESGGSGSDVDLSQRDALFEEAARVVVMTQQGSTSMIQRKMKIGYNRAGRIIDQLEAASIVGPFEGSKARQVLVSDEYALEQLLNELDK